MTPEEIVSLAPAALAAPLIQRALALAEWTGLGRQMTASEVLRPDDAVAACAVLGISLDGRPRSAKDVPQLAQAWDVAVAAGLVKIGGKRASTAPAVPAMLHAARTGEPLSGDLARRAVDGWMQAALLPIGSLADPCPFCLASLCILAASAESPSATQFTELLSAEFLAADEGEQCPDCGQFHGGGFTGDSEVIDAVLGHARLAGGGLAALGATSVAAGPDGGTLALTDLGRLLTRTVIHPFLAAEGASAADVVTKADGLPPVARFVAASGWLGSREPTLAARELLAYAEQAGPGPRATAIGLAEALGDGAAPAWRDLAARPGFGAYGRRWLRSQGLDGPDDDRDGAWFLADEMERATAGVPEELVTLVLGQAITALGISQEERGEALATLRSAGHPFAGQLERVLEQAAAGMPATSLEALARALGPVGYFGEDAPAEEELPEGTEVTVKVTLKNVSKPPVWRRITVPVSLPLDAFHEVLQAAMGWENAHLHSFADDVADYGPGEADLEIEDEAEFTVADLGWSSGDRFTYTYDFGDDWVHDIRVEDVIMTGGKSRPPVLLAGKGACPPEDCGGPWGYQDLKAAVADPRHPGHHDAVQWVGRAFDPAAFSMDEATIRLRTVRATAR